MRARGYLPSARRRQAGVRDFDDLLADALEVEPPRPACFRHLLVDEFQDCDELQYELIRAWSQKGESLFAIGDPDQSIYGFRGASPTCFARLEEDFPDLERVRLVQNYRSTPEILGAALPVIDRNPGPARVLVPQGASGAPVRLLEAESDLSEAIFVAKEVARQVGGVDMLEAQSLGHEREVRAFSDIAVLCRTHRQLELMEKCLRHDDIPCIVSGREDFLDADEVRGLLAFFRFLQEPRDAAALETALRLIWDCPADLTEKARAVCAALPNFDPASLRRELGESGPLVLWLDGVRQWLPLVNREKPWKLIEQWQAQYGSTPALDRLRDMAVFHATFGELWNALALCRRFMMARPRPFSVVPSPSSTSACVSLKAMSSS